jgi:hypothetical protein
LPLKGEFAVVPTDKIEGGAYHQKFPELLCAEQAFKFFIILATVISRRKNQ